MAPRRNSRAREARLAFEAISIEGALLSADSLARIAQLAAGLQSGPDYGVLKGLHLRDEIGRYWRVAQALWSEFDAGLKDRADPMALARRFVLGLLRDALGFGTLRAVEPVTVAERSWPIGFAALGGRVPVVIAPAGSGLDALGAAPGDGGRRRSAFGLAQEYLNAADGALWGVVSDGLTLRIARDNSSLTRPAWIEADLQRIFSEERYADFAALWLLAHESRFGRPEQPVTACALETWRDDGLKSGTAAREKLRYGVKDALLALGQGFLAHPDNTALRAALQGGALTKEDYFNQLLRLVYRLIFLLTVEERGLLHPEGTDEPTRQRYAEGYSLARLRERAARRSAHDRHSDLWDATRVVLRGVATGQPRLGLPSLAGLFAPSQCPDLDAARIENRSLLLAVFKLAWLRDSDAVLARVNWRDMNTEELGGVYEILLELVPQITGEGRKFTFATGAETKGNERKKTGSYYTPDSLVQLLLDSALDPVIRDTLARHPSDPVEALLGLAIVDPACGSGHFLLAAARRLADHVARLQADGTPSAAEYRHALRQVVGRCIYGVDLNPMAVELCKVGLWLEALEPGRPLTFLDSHVQHGNALLGATPELMAKGVPDAAWEPIEGDDRKLASALKKRNKQAGEGQRSLDTLWSKPVDAEAQTIARAVAELDAAGDASPEALAQKESRWEGILGSTEYRHQRFVADAWCAAFVWPKTSLLLADAAPTSDVWRQLRDAQGQAPALVAETVGALAKQYRFFHWHLQFPQVFARGGFDVVLGNPPWERVKLQEQEFFAPRHDAIAGAANASVRKQLIARLPKEDPTLWDEWCAASRGSEGESHFIRQSGRYPLCGRGDVNTFAIFAEHNRSVVQAKGAVGCILPAGIATDDTTKEFFQTIVSTQTLRSIFHFENEDRLFVGVNNMFRYVLLTITGAEVRTPSAEVVAFARNRDDVLDPSRRYRLSAAEIEALNPNTRTFPTFFSRRAADINLALYRRAGVLWKEDDRDGNPWGIRFMAMLHMANDSGLFRTRPELEAGGWGREGNRYVLGEKAMLPLYEGKMTHHFDHRFATYEGATQANLNKGTLPQATDSQHADPHFTATPEYWVADSEVDSRLNERWQRGWLLGWRDITNAHNERTVIASLIPRVGVGHTTPLMFTERDTRLVASLYANLCSFALDYTARQKVGGTHLSYSYLKQLPVLAPRVYAADAPWSPGTSLRDWILPRVLELTYTAWDLESFARDCSYEGPPFRWDPARRFVLRAELDAAFFLLYGLSRDDADYILDTFPVVRKHDERDHDEYRTKRVILERYDALAAAARIGRAYVSALPPPGDTA